MDLGTEYGNLTYSTLVHPGDTWEDMKASLQQYVPEVKKRISPDKPFGVSLRLANSSVETLIAQPQERAWLKKFLTDNDLYIISESSDRLDLLAHKYYGDKSLWWVIAVANNLNNASLYIGEGVQLRIPSNLSQILNDLEKINR